MYGLIKTGIRLTIFSSIYAGIIANILGWVPLIATSIASLGDMPVAVASSVLCASQTLNWLFGKDLVDIAMYIWLFLPPVKLLYYFYNKAAHM